MILVPSSRIPSIASHFLSRAGLVLLQPFDLALGLVVVLLERGAQLIGVGSLRHLWQRFVDLLFGVIDVFLGCREKGP
jgi:cytochrome c biogenesis protein CcdA